MSTSTVLSLAVSSRGGLRSRGADKGKGYPSYTEYTEYIDAVANLSTMCVTLDVTHPW